MSIDLQASSNGIKSARPTSFLLFVAGCSLFVSLLGCDRSKRFARPASRPAHPTVASLVPAATDLIFGMGLADQLVGVSTYDRGRADIGARPAVGDYQTVDWEQLASLKPNCMIVQIAADRLPAGLKSRADALHIKLIDIKIDTVDDIFRAIGQLGHALDAPSQAGDAASSLRRRLETVRNRSKGHAPVSTLMVLNEAGTAVAGPGSFLDEVLTCAGGVNAAASLGQPWPMIDDETLHTLKPDAVIVLLPGASPQSVDQAKAAWARRTEVPAVVAGHITVVTSWYALLPGWHVADLAESIAACLRPATTSTRVSSRNGVEHG